MLLAVLTGTTACGSSHGEPAGPLADAQATAVGKMRNATAAIFPPGFALQPLPSLPANCTDAADRPTGYVLVGVTFWVDGVPASQNNSYFDALHGWWVTHGWTPRVDLRPADMFANATSNDGYLMSLRANVGARLTIGATTPCLLANGTATPPTSAQLIPPASPQPPAATSTPSPIPPASPPPATTLHFWPAARIAQRRAA
ncbi:MULTISPECIES: hypothetical protein [unclassified Amycolatopsis]|uniref:hypothetical protein n=1 Tax=unclassified Amycolatopsis TaxID=2618356 RepID=UPI0028767940|nr:MULTISPECIES: hypothetical protein [unclassified Amycolatopsis]MDS0140568.1 hypothetical protein [Amycolatopsis sp. 505]MDS0149218.1 hypothetical protein [Amycolatopsis sp. CM201R]